MVLNTANLQICMTFSFIIMNFREFIIKLHEFMQFRVSRLSMCRAESGAGGDADGYSMTSTAYYDILWCRGSSRVRAGTWQRLGEPRFITVVATGTWIAVQQ